MHGILTKSGWSREKVFRFRRSIFGKLILQRMVTRKTGVILGTFTRWTNREIRWVDMRADDFMQADLTLGRGSLEEFQQHDEPLRMWS